MWLCASLSGKRWEMIIMELIWPSVLLVPPGIDYYLMSSSKADVRQFLSLVFRSLSQFVKFCGNATD
jgi:hypothetical protein